MDDMAGLDPTAPVCVRLSEKYNVPPMVIAYIRSALMRDDNKYDRNSLMVHIIEENQERKKEIGQLKLSITEENIDSVKEQILAIQKKMDFRQGALAVLRNVEDRHLRDILQNP